MTFAEKLYNARKTLNLSQIELAEKVGITERSIYSYEQTGTFPRTAVVKRLAEVLGVSVAYLMDENETDMNKNISEELFIANVKNEFGSKGAKEAQAILDRTAALFAGGELDDEAKDIFLQSITEVYFESKAEARAKFSPKRNKA